MKVFRDLLIAIPIGIIYNIISHKSAEIFTNNLSYDDKEEQQLIISFGSGVFALLMGYFVFGLNNKYKNRIVRYGLYVGAFLLLLHSIMYNWHNLKNDTKLIIMTLALVALISYIYYNLHDSDESSDKQYDDSDASKYLPATYTDQNYGLSRESFIYRDKSDDEQIINY